MFDEKMKELRSGRIAVDDDYLRDCLTSWFKEKTPEFYKKSTDPEFKLFIVNILSLKDVFLSAKLIERTTGKKPDLNLISMILLNYNQWIIERLIQNKAVSEACQY